METQANTIETVFLGVVEKLAFMFGDPCDANEIRDTPGSWVRATIEFEGTMTGSFSLTVPEALCAEISANILGLEPNDIADSGLARDSLKEMLNVACGRVVPALQGAEHDFDLGVPFLDELSHADVKELSGLEGVTCFDLDGSPIMLGLSLQGDEVC